MRPARIAYASCPLGGNTAIFDLRETDCARRARWQPALRASIGWCRCDRCGMDVIARKR
jgi:hypothetical protein